MVTLLPPDKKVVQLLPRREPFEVLYRLNCDNLCSDFKEDISFKFSFGIMALINRVMGGRDREIKTSAGFLSGHQVLYLRALLAFLATFVPSYFRGQHFELCDPIKEIYYLTFSSFIFLFVSFD